MRAFTDQHRANLAAAARCRWTDAERERTATSRRIPVDAARIVSEYEAGKTVRDIASGLTISASTVRRSLQRAGAGLREATDYGYPRGGPEGPNWRGDEATRQALHNRVYRELGQPLRCDVCGLDDPGRMYHWANLTGNYADTSDYRRMCVPCHRRYDNARKPS